MRINKGACGVGAVATARGRRAVRARRRQRRRWRWRWRGWRRRRGWSRWRMAGALAVDHVLDVHEAIIVPALVHGRRRRCHEGVRTIRARGQRHHLGTLEKGGSVDNRNHCGRRPKGRNWAAPAVHLFAVGHRVHDELIRLIVIRVCHQHSEVALPLHRRHRCLWRRRRRRRGSRRWRRVASWRRGRQRWRRRGWWRQRRRQRRAASGGGAARCHLKVRVAAFRAVAVREARGAVGARARSSVWDAAPARRCAAIRSESAQPDARRGQLRRRAVGGASRELERNAR